MELPGAMGSLWRECTLDLIEHVRVKKIISRLHSWSGKGQQVVFNFSKYLERFRFGSLYLYLLDFEFGKRSTP